MAETIITKDGKCHTLLGSTTPVSIIREYCGDEVIRAIADRVSEICSDIDSIAEASEAHADDIQGIETLTQELNDIFY